MNVAMESKGGKKKCSSSSSSSWLQYEAPLGYSIEDVRPNGGIEKFRSAAYSNVSSLFLLSIMAWHPLFLFLNPLLHPLFAVPEEAILIYTIPQMPAPSVSVHY